MQLMSAKAAQTVDNCPYRSTDGNQSILSFMLEERFLNVRRRLLWVDCVAGLVVGLMVVLLNDRLSVWYNLPQVLVFALGIINLAYGTYSLFLVLRKKRPLKLLRFLVGGNLLWTAVCIGLVLAFLDTASPLGLVLLLGEGLFVGGLGILEWQSRELLLTV